MLQTIFREQSVGWATIAYDYFESTVKAIEKFITQLLKVLVSEEGIRYNIQTRLAPAGKGASYLSSLEAALSLALLFNNWKI